METIAEQVHYGNYCVHGTSVGTPGGADLMCGDCEAGYTYFRKCGTCGMGLWLRRDGEQVECKPNPRRIRLAAKTWQARKLLDNQTLLRLIAIQRLPKRIHFYPEEE